MCPYEEFARLLQRIVPSEQDCEAQYSGPCTGRSPCSGHGSCTAGANSPWWQCTVENPCGGTGTACTCNSGWAGESCEHQAMAAPQFSGLGVLGLSGLCFALGAAWAVLMMICWRHSVTAGLRQSSASEWFTYASVDVESEMLPLSSRNVLGTFPGQAQQSAALPSATVGKGTFVRDMAPFANDRKIQKCASWDASFG